MNLAVKVGFRGTDKGEAGRLAPAGFVDLRNQVCYRALALRSVSEKIIRGIDNVTKDDASSSQSSFR
jgi:hypothetical protein